MAEVLSQNEIDALLAAVSAGTVDTKEPEATAGAKGDWIVYDLASQEKIFRGRLVALEGIHERFARYFRITLSNYLKKNVTVSCTNIDFLKFGDYATNILLPASLNVLSMTNLQGHMIFLVTSKLTYALVDSYFGGSERPFAKIGSREEFTGIENNMIQKICHLAIADLEEAWRLNYPLHLEFLQTESNPAFVGRIHATELVAVANFEVEFESLSGPFILIVQLRALDPIAASLSVNVTSEVKGDLDVWKSHWLRELAALPLDVKVELGATERTLHQIQDWKAGDVIALAQDSVAPLGVMVEGLEKFDGLMGVYRGNNAVKLVTKE
jgi:flagellar motor switch protein FliM